MTDDQRTPPWQKPQPPSAAGIEKKLDEILQQLRHLARLQQHRDFSISRLIASISQLLVMALLFWSVIGVLDLGNLTAGSAMQIKLIAAIVLQLLALTFFILDRQDR